MGLFSKKKKQPTGDKACQQGYVSFTPEDIKAKEETSKDNREAYDLLWQAVTTSSNISKKDKNGDTVPIDDVYPVSLEETLEMENLLNEAESKINDPSDAELKSRIDEVRYIINWSKKRHYNFSFIIILGVILGIFVMKNFKSDPSDKADKWNKIAAKSEKWDKLDTIITWEDAKARNYKSYEDYRFKSANIYKAMVVEKNKYIYENNINYISEQKTQLDTIKDRDKIKKTKEYIKSAEKDADNALKTGQELVNTDLKDIKKFAKDDALNCGKGYRKEARKWSFWIWVFIIMIPLYVIAERPYGWMQTRHRVEAEVLGGIRKIGYSIAAFFVTMGIGMKFLADEKITMFNYDTGRNEVTTRANVGNIYIMIMKFGLVVLGLIVAALTSMFIMTYSTIVGLKRNYNWSSIKADAIDKLGKK